MAQFRYRHNDGTWRWIEGTRTNLLDDPRVRGVVSNYRDITERRQAHETIRRLSTPVLSVGERLLVLPVIGEVDQQRADQLCEQLLHSIRSHRARVVVLDVTGVPFMGLDITCSYFLRRRSSSQTSWGEPPAADSKTRAW